MLKIIGGDCVPRKGEYQDLTGMRFNRLTVIKLLERTSKRKYIWLCKCDCGNEIKVSSEHLKSNHTRSCGCLNRERISSVNYKNGLCRTKLYYTYCNMCNRCNRKDNYEYLDYGGRGISVCKELLGENGFVKFAEWALSSGYKEEFTLDRIDNEKGYSPENCRWVDRFIQGNNKRNNRFIKINGEVGTVANMSRKYSVDYWNLMHYSKGGKNCKYPDLRIEVVNDAEIQEYRKSEGSRAKKQRTVVESKS